MRHPHLRAPARASRHGVVPFLFAKGRGSVVSASSVSQPGRPRLGAAPVAATPTWPLAHGARDWSPRNQAILLAEELMMRTRDSAYVY